MNDTVLTISSRVLRRAAVGLVVAVALLLLAVIGWQLRDRFDLGGILARGAGNQIDHSTYQAVFLTAGQLYFGKLATRGDDYFLLSDVYYLNPGEGAAAPPQSSQLIKRGRELHGPEDVMVIPARAVNFIENLRPDGEVMTAIRRFKAGESAPSTGAPAPGATAAPPPASTPVTSPRPSPTR